jgi:heterodisulfide reductase subunit C/nitrate reductase gamma subunit
MLKYSFYISFAIFIAGLIFRLAQWIRFDLDTESAEQSKVKRTFALWESLWNHIVSAQVLLMIKAFFWDGLLQARILKSSPLRWLTHMSIFWGFILLLLFHALDDHISVWIFPNYASTINPYMFLRNLCGFFVLSGIILAFYRRRKKRIVKHISNWMDYSVLGLIAAIIISGFLVEAIQIISERQFDNMVSDYVITDDESEILALRAYWAKYYSVSFAQPVDISSPILLETGHSLHEDSCVSCHSRPQYAFVSFNLVQLFAPFATVLNALHMDAIILIVHYMLCFIGLAWLPFSKMFHMITTPLNYCLTASSQESKHSAAVANGKIVSLDACTHCGVCSEHCSVAPIYQVIGNDCILPSEKIGAVLSMAAGRHPIALENLSSGNAICTECNQCTNNCPSGIPLLDIWQNTKKELQNKGMYRPEDLIQSHSAYEWAEIWKSQKPTTPPYQSFISDDPQTYEACVQCSVCTQVCPIVAAASNNGDPIDVTPQQVMNLLRIGLKDKALGTQMVWTCATCYMCQENCPQHIPVADVFYELRNLAHAQINFKQTGEK